MRKARRWRFRYSIPTIPIATSRSVAGSARVTEEGASAHIDSLAKKYLGKDKYPWTQPGQVRVTFEIEPGTVQAQG